MPIRAYSYLRISTDIQKAGDGVRRQLDESRAYAEAHGYELVETIQDIGVSGFRGKNSTEGAFAGFLDAIEAGQVLPGSVLIIESLDRLSRDGATRAFSQFAGILSKGVKIVTLLDRQEYTEGSVNSNPGQLFTSLGVMIRANEESSTKSRRLQAAWEQKRSKIHSKKLTSRIPAWLKFLADSESFEVIESSAVTVRAIFDLCIAGVGTYSITRLLNEDKVRYPPISQTDRWNKSYVMKILNNRAVLGEFQPKKNIDGQRVNVGGVIKDYYPEIVTEENFLLAQKALRQRRTGSAGRKGKTYANLFTNVAKCGNCGASLTYRNKGKPPKGGTYLQCYNSVSNNGCNRPAWKYLDFQNSFFDFVGEVDFGSLFAETTELDRLTLIRNLEVAEERKLALDAQASQLYDRMISLDTTPEVFQALKVRAERLNTQSREHSDTVQELRHQVSRRHVSYQSEQKSFLNDYSKLEEATDENDMGLIRAKLHGQIKRFVDSVIVYNGFRMEPWEIEGNLPSRYSERLAKQGTVSLAEIEQFLGSAVGQRDFDTFQRYFVVRFKSGARKFVRPSLRQEEIWVSERLAQLNSL